MKNVSALQRLAIVDDHKVIGKAMISLFSTLLPDLKVDYYSTAKTFLTAQKRSPYGSILLDIKLKEECGLGLCRHIKQHYPQTRVIMFSAHADIYHIRMAELYAADGYLKKDCEADELKLALKKVICQGGTYFSAELEQTKLDFEMKIKPLTAKNGNILSGREMEVLTLICEGCNNEEIAKVLTCEKNTVNKHRQNGKQKVGASNSFQLLNFAIEHGIYNPRKLNKNFGGRGNKRVR